MDDQHDDEGSGSGGGPESVPRLRLPERWDADHARPDPQPSTRARPAAVRQVGRAPSWPRAWAWAGALVVVAVASVWGLAALRAGGAQPSTGDGEAAPRTTAVAPSRRATTARRVAPSARGAARPDGSRTSPLASAMPAPSAVASAARLPRSEPPDPTTCLSALMPSDAFGNPAPDLAFCCTGTDARATTLALKAAVVRAGGYRVTRAMREWSELGWYETAAFSVMRAYCCPDAPALTVKGRKIAACKLEESLAWLANAIDDPAAMQEAVRGYTRAVRCIYRQGYGERFGQVALPTGHELTLLDGLLERIAADRRGR